MSPLNTQPTEKSDLRADGLLAVREVFFTIQGEGPFAGTPAVFVRLAGCNLQCPGCDTDYTSFREMLDPHKLVARVRDVVPSGVLALRQNRRLLLVLTGGEPFRQNFVPFVRTMIGLGWNVQVETNGTLWFDGVRELLALGGFFIVCSPKTGRISRDIARHACAFKYVVQIGHVSGIDGLPTATLGQLTQIEVARPLPVADDEAGKEIFVQPLDEKDAAKNAANLELAVQICMTFGHRLCVQIHKEVNLP